MLTGFYPMMATALELMLSIDTLIMELLLMLLAVIGLPMTLGN